MFSIKIALLINPVSHRSVLTHVLDYVESTQCAESEIIFQSVSATKVSQEIHFYNAKESQVRYKYKCEVN